MRADRGVHDIADACLCCRTRAWIKRHLVDRAQEQTGIMLEGSLGAIAVVHVEIDDGHAGHTERLGDTRRYRHGREQAEAHGPVRLCMVPRRSDGGEGTAGPAIGHGLDRIDDSPRRQPGGSNTARRQHCVGVQLDRPRCRRGIEDAGDVVRRVDAFQIGNRGFGRCVPVEAEVRILDRRHDGRQTLRTFGMSGSCSVLDHVGMGKQGDAHADTIRGRNALVADDDIEIGV